MEGSPPKPRPADTQQQDCNPNLNFSSDSHSPSAVPTRQSSSALPTTQHNISTMTASGSKSKSKSNKSRSKEPSTGSAGPSTQAKLDSITPAGSQPAVKKNAPGAGGEGGSKISESRPLPGQDGGGRAEDVGNVENMQGWQSIQAQRNNRTEGSGNPAMRPGNKSGGFQSIPVPRNSSKGLDEWHRMPGGGGGGTPGSNMGDSPGPQNMQESSPGHWQSIPSSGPGHMTHGPVDGYGQGYNTGEASMRTGHNLRHMHGDAGGSVGTTPQQEQHRNFHGRSGSLHELPADVPDMSYRGFRSGAPEPQVSPAAEVLRPKCSY